MPISDDQKAAICRITPHTSHPSARRGTGFLVDKELVLTAFHVVGDAKTGTLYAESFRFEFRLGIRNAKVFETASVDVVKSDRDQDWALLRCKEPPPIAALPIGPLRNSYLIHFDTFGFPDAAKVKGMPYSGTINALGAEIAMFAASALEQRASKIEGLSGSPCIVNGVAVGIVVESSDPMRQNSTQGGMMFAVPISIVAEAYADLPFPKELPPFVAEVAQALEPGPLLKRVAAQEKLPEAASGDPESLRMAVAGHMLRGGVYRTNRMLQQLRQLLAIDAAERILFCAGSLWVHEDAAAALARAVTPPAAATIAINAALDDTALRYLHRAGYPSCGHPGWTRFVGVLTPPQGEQQIDALLASTRELLQHHFKCEAPEIAGELMYAGERGEPVFAVIPPPPPSAKAMAALRRDYPTVRFVLLAGEALTEMGAALGDIVMLEPRIGKDFEARNFGNYTTTLNALIRFFADEPTPSSARTTDRRRA